MNVFQCDCGARYKVPPGSEGRTVRCKQCGRTAQLPTASEGPIPLADDSHSGQLAAVEAAAATASGSMFQASAVGTALDDHDARPAPRFDSKPAAGFWEDVGWNFLFFINPGSMVIIVVFWVLQIGLEFISGTFGGLTLPVGGRAGGRAVAFMLFAVFFIQMFFIAWYMRIVSDTASGEDDLPSFAPFDHPVEDIVSPAAQYAASWFLLMAPALGYAIYAGGNLPGIIASIIAGADLSELLAVGSGAAGILLLLAGVALFLWPMVLLCVSMAGLGSLVRIDLIVTAVVNTFLPYSAIAGMVGVATFVPGLIIRAAAAAAPAGGGAGATAWLIVIACGVEAYFTIVMMRLIGLYYRHYKVEFPWDWE